MSRRILGSLASHTLRSRIFFAIAAGIAAGVVGSVGVGGLLFYVSFEIFFCFMYMGLMGGSWHRFFTSASAFVLCNIFQSFMSFILFWALVFNIVHVY